MKEEIQKAKLTEEREGGYSKRRAHIVLDESRCKCKQHLALTFGKPL